MLIDLWADVTCPWCYLGVRHLRRALAALPFGDEVEVRPHAFFLDPELDATQDVDRRTYLLEHSILDAPALDAQDAQLRDLARAEGVNLDLEHLVVAPAANAQRVIVAARRADIDAGATTGADTLALKVWEAIARAHWEMALDIADPEVLVGCAQDVGMDPAAALGAIVDGTTAQDVFSDFQVAARSGVERVPTMLVDGTWVIEGMQEIEALVRALTTAHDQREEEM